ncbi:MAG: Ig-like domain-containing protein [Oscillospiraceae bacterium]|nr:Ig-like domain-containing protein [Oscillospiraceae bacterium]
MYNENVFRIKDPANDIVATVNDKSHPKALFDFVVENGRINVLATMGTKSGNVVGALSKTQIASRGGVLFEVDCEVLRDAPEGTYNFHFDTENDRANIAVTQSNVVSTYPFTIEEKEVLIDSTKPQLLEVRDDGTFVEMGAKNEVYEPGTRVKIDDEGEILITATHEARPYDMILNGNREHIFTEPGKYYVMIKDGAGNKSTPYSFTIKNNVTSMQITEPIVKLTVGQIYQLKTVFTPQAPTNKKILWSSDSPFFADVDEYGRVTAKERGEAIITAISEDGGFVSTSRVVVEVPARKLSVDQTHIKHLLGVDNEMFVNVTVTVSKQFKQIDCDIEYSSSDTRVATIEPLGGDDTLTADSLTRGYRITALAPGEAIMYFNSGGKTVSTTVTVYEYDETGLFKVELDHPTKMVDKSSSPALVSYITPRDANPIVVPPDRVSYVSDVPRIVTVDENTGCLIVNDVSEMEAPRKIKIRCTLKDDPLRRKFDIEVTITPNNITHEVEIKYANAEEVQDLESIQEINGQKMLFVDLSNEMLKSSFNLCAVLTNTDGDVSIGDYRRVRWRSSDSTVASVDAFGNVNVKNVGTAEISAMASDGTKITDTVIINSNRSAQKLTLNYSAISLRQEASLKLKVTVTPKDANNVDVIWESSDTSVATVDNRGYVVVSADAPAGASTTIKATLIQQIPVLDASGMCEVDASGNIVYSNETLTAECIIYATDVDVRSITISHRTLYMTVGEVSDDMLSVASAVTVPENTPITPVWASSDENIVQIIGIKADGKPEIKAVAPGQAKITVSAGGKTSECDVIVYSDKIDPKDKLAILLDPEPKFLDKNTKAQILVRGIQLGRPTPNEIPISEVSFEISRPELLSINYIGDEAWLSVSPNVIKDTTVNIVASLKNDPLNRQAVIKVTVTARSLSTFVDIKYKDGSPIDDSSGEKTIFVDLSDINVKRGINLTTFLLNTDGTTSEGLSSQVKWKSSDAGVASINPFGELYIRSTGEAIVSATVADGSECKDEVKVVVFKRTNGLKLNTDKLSLRVGQYYTLKATTEPKNTTNYEFLVWESSNENVVTVSDGKVKAVAAGHATVTATINDSGSIPDGQITTAICDITVEDSGATSITLSEKIKIIMPDDEHVFELKATTVPEDANVSFGTSDPEILTVSPDGFVTVHKTGKATVTATIPGKTATCVVSTYLVDPDADLVAVLSPEGKYFDKNTTPEIKIYSQIKGEDPVLIDTQNIEFSVQNSLALTVEVTDDTAKIIPNQYVRNDTFTTITAYLKDDPDGRNVVIPVTITPDTLTESVSIRYQDDSEIQLVNVSENDDEMDLQKSIFVELNQDNPKTIYSLKAVPEFTIPVIDEPDVAFRWSSTVPAVARVDKYGNVVINGPGTTTIKAIVNDGSGKMDTVIFTVSKKTERVQLSVDTLSLVTGQSFKVTAVTDPDDAAQSGNIMWGIAGEPEDVTENNLIKFSKGNLKAKNEIGQAIIYAKVIEELPLTEANGDYVLDAVTQKPVYEINEVIDECEVTITSTPVRNITLSRRSLEMLTNSGTQLFATVDAENGVVVEPAWASSNENSVTVDQYGNVTAHKPGRAKITVTAAGKTAECEVVVYRVDPKAKLKVVSEPEIAIINQYTEPLFKVYADIVNEGSEEINATELDIRVSDPSVMQIEYEITPRLVNGTLVDWYTAKANVSPSLQKEARVDVYFELRDDPQRRKTKLTLRVTPRDITQDIDVINNDESDIQVVNVPTHLGYGDYVEEKSIYVNMSDPDETLTRAFKAVITRESGNEIASGTDVYWKTTNYRVASIDRFGKATIKGPGTCKIYAITKDGTQLTDEVTITVQRQTERLVLATNRLALYPNKSKIVKASAIPSGSNAAAQVEWYTDNAELIDVTDSGKITALNTRDMSGNNTATLYASLSEQVPLLTPDGTYDLDSNGEIQYETREFIAECELTVYDTEVSRVSLTGGKLTLTLGTDEETSILSANTVPADMPVVWAVSDDSIATITQDGVITGLSTGKVTVTASAGHAKATKVVEVYKLHPSEKLVAVHASGATTFEADELAVENSHEILVYGSLGSPVDMNDVSFITSSQHFTVEKTNDGRAFLNFDKPEYMKGDIRANIKIKLLNDPKSRVTNLSVRATENKLVEEVYVTSYDTNVSVLSPTEFQVPYTKYKRVTLSAEALPAEAKSKQVSWSSSNYKIARVNSNGVVTIYGSGVVEITATARDGSNIKQTVTLYIN